MKIKYPRYTREQCLNCKLSDDDIKMIKYLRVWNRSIKKIAKRFKVSENAVYYWLLSPQKRKKRNREQYLRYERFKDKETIHEIQNRSYRRKCGIMPEFKKYLNLLHKKYNKKYRKLLKNKKYENK